MKRITLIFLLLFVGSALRAQDKAVIYTKLATNITGIGTSGNIYGSGLTAAQVDSAWSALDGNGGIVAGFGTWVAYEVQGTDFTHIQSGVYNVLHTKQQEQSVLWPYQVAGAISGATVSSGYAIVGTSSIPDSSVTASKIATGAISLTTQVSGTLPIANGGTNSTTQQAAIDALTGTQSSGKYLRSNGTHATLSALQAADISDTASVQHGGTGDKTLTSHGVLIGEGTNNVAVTSAGASNTVLHGNTGADPTYSAVALNADVSGTLPIANGGTAVTSPNALVDTNTASATIAAPTQLWHITLLSKSSAAATDTIAAPTSAMTGQIWHFKSTTAKTHIVYCIADGFNAKGSSGNVTLGGAIGDGFSIIAANGHWYVLTGINDTVN